jgi:hypothetical protein
MINFSRIFYEILVYCKYFLGWEDNEPEFVGIGKHPKLGVSEGDIKITRITCYLNEKYKRIKH